MNRRVGDVPEQVERPEAPVSADQVNIVRRIEDSEDFKPERLREVSEVPLPEVQGFERSGLITDQEVRDHLGESFPPEHISPESLTSVEYEDRYVSHQDGNIVGITEYNPLMDTSKVEIYRQEPDGNFDRSEMERTIAHEVGHSTYNDMEWPPTSPRHQEWEQLSTSSTPGEYVSEYARTSVQEDFAESYAAYIHDGLAQRIA